MCPLDGATPRAFAQVVDILESLSRHLPMSLARMRGLVLGYCPQDRLPDVAQQTGYVDADAWQGDGERRNEARGVSCGVEVDPA